MSAVSSQFADKIALVTGAGTGIGAATALLLAQRGANVALVGRAQSPLDNVADAISALGGKSFVVLTDVADPTAIEQAVSQTVAMFGGLHLAVNNAGVASENHDLPELPLPLWEDTIAINLSGVFYAMRAELPAIEQSGGGAIVNISSVFGDRGLPMRAAYSASKHGIRGLTRSAARDWAARGIRINELQPGVIQTPMIEGAPETAALAAMIPAGRVGRAEEIAAAVAFLLSEDASYIVGAHLAVDGGFLD